MTGIYIYCVALIAQLLATSFAIHLYLKARTYRIACGLFALGFGLMIGRRVTPIFNLLNDDKFDPFDAWLSVFISLSLLIGIFHVKQAWSALESKNFRLDQSLKEDGLTGALSRSETFCRAEMEIERSLRRKESVAPPLTILGNYYEYYDRAMYQAKKAGRNQVMIYSS